MKKVTVLNIEFDNIKLNDLLSSLSSGVIFTPNVDHLIRLQNDEEFYKVYQIADYVLCDSKIVQWASAFLGTPIVEKISGSDFFPSFCHYHRRNDNIKIYILGAAEGIARKAADRINNRLGRNIIIDYCSPSFGFERNENESLDIVQHVNESKATVLAVGVGSPKQERWIARYKDFMPTVKIFMAIGATIDFEAGNIRRAPRWMREIGLEWMFRFILEPKRLWRRYFIDDIKFFKMIIDQKMNFPN